MEDAFRTALNDLAQRRHETPNLDRRSVQFMLNATASRAAESTPATGVSFAKVLYAARKLGRGWATYTNPWGETPSRLARLRDDWIMLAASFLRLPIQQRMTVLRAFVEGLELGHVPSSARKSSYLDRQRARCPEHFSGLSEIPGVRPTSQAAFVVYALEELADSAPPDRQELHARLAEAAPADGSRSPDWLFAELVAWLTPQHERTNDPAA
jgi:hypothetical protein